MEFLLLHWQKITPAAISLAVFCAVIWHMFQPKIPTISVPMEKYEKSDEELVGESFPEMLLKDPSRPGKVQCYDPSTLKKLGEVEAMTPERVHEAVAKSRTAQAEWAKTSFSERRRVLNTIQNYILSHQDDICRVCALDSGKPKLDALLGEVLTTCEKIRCVCANGEKWLKPDYRPVGPLMTHKNAFVEYQPLGVLGVIAPWNYPFHNMMNHVISGTFAGNGVVSKVSEYTSWSSRYFTSIVREALSACGHNPDLVQTITGFGEAGSALVNSDVDKIIFTGSPGVGKKVMEGAAPLLKPVILELGGKDPLIVCDDCNINDVMPMVMRGCFQNCGQNCCGVERVYVYESIYEQFVDIAVRLTKALRQGPPLGKEQIDCGAMVMPAQINIIQSLVDDAIAKGARCLVGGKRNSAFPHGNFYEPTVLADVTHSMLIAKEEVFGPVMCILKVQGNSDVEAVKMVNDCKYGLGSSVFSKSQPRAEKIANSIRAGMCCVNDFGVNYLVQALPFGGVKDSGFDRFAGPEGLRACCLMRSVVVDKFSWFRTSIPKPLQYPIAPSGLDFGKGMVGIMYSETIFERIASVIKLLRAALSK